MAGENKKTFPGGKVFLIRLTGMTVCQSLKIAPVLAEVTIFAYLAR